MLKIKKIKPIFNQIVTTRNMYDNNVTFKSSKLIDGTRINTMKEYQTVLAIGPTVRGIKVGDIVWINPKRYGVPLHEFGAADKDNIQKDNMHMTFNIPSFPVYDREDGSCRDVLLITDGDVECVVEGEEFDENPKIITEKQHKLIL